MPPREPTSMLRAAVRPRMLVLLVLLLAAALVCGLLGRWQLERAQLRGELAAQQEAATAQGVTPVPLTSVLEPQTSFTADRLGRAVTVTGTYDADGQLLVTDRALDGRDGYLVLTPLRVDLPADATAADAGTADDAGTAGDAGAGRAPVLPVVRGWVASPDDAGSVPAGPVELTGYLQASEAAGALDVAAGRAEAVSTAQLVNVWGGPIYSGYLVLATASPAQDAALEPLGPPQPRGGAGWDLRNLGYALQWWIFGLFAVALWLRLVRDEANGELAPGEDLPADGDPASAQDERAGTERAVTGRAGADASP